MFWDPSSETKTKQTTLKNQALYSKSKHLQPESLQLYALMIWEYWATLEIPLLQAPVISDYANLSP